MQGARKSAKFKSVIDAQPIRNDIGRELHTVPIHGPYATAYIDKEAGDDGSGGAAGDGDDRLFSSP
jgi:hypothetical protein